MAYTKQTWTDSPATTTPISAARLGVIEQGIYDAHLAAGSAASAASTAASNAATAASAAATAAANASTAFDLADGKNKVYYQDNPPTGGSYKVGDLWFDTNAGYKLHTWSGSTWVNAFATLEGSISTALTSADGKNRNYYSATTPTPTPNAVAGDLWFDTSQGNRISRYTGSSWSLEPLGNTAVANLDAGAITTGSLNALRLQSTQLNADNMTTGTLLAGRIGTATLLAKNYWSDVDGNNRIIIGPTAVFGAEPRIVFDYTGNGATSTDPSLRATSSGLQLHGGTASGASTSITMGLPSQPDRILMTAVSTGGLTTTAELDASIGRFTVNKDVTVQNRLNVGEWITAPGIDGGATQTGVPNLRIQGSGGAVPYNIAKTTHINSAARYKHDILDIDQVPELDPHRVLGIAVRSFRFNEGIVDPADCRHDRVLPGLIAEEVHAAYPIAVDVNEDGSIQTWNERYLIPAMLALIQEQHHRLLALEAA
jgi:hypothetical protein